MTSKQQQAPALETMNESTLESPLRYRGTEVMTLRQLDRLNNAPKGTTFRAFKQARPGVGLQEGTDFFRLEGGEHPAFIASLAQRGLVYPATVNLVLITRRGYTRLRSAGHAETN